MEKVADGVNSLAGQRFGDARAHALYIPYGGGEFEHAIGENLLSLRNEEVNHRKDSRLGHRERQAALPDFKPTSIVGGSAQTREVHRGV